MPKVVGVRFGPATKIYSFDPGEFEDLQAGDYVIVETVRGRELGRVVQPPHEVPEGEIVGKLKPVVRKAEPWDLLLAESFAAKEKEALEICKAKVAEHQLPMKLVRAEYNFDGSHLTFYFTAEHRVDFRALVRDLAKTFKTRIELRQIGVRDEAKLMGGLGPCGRPLCCSTWLCEFAPTSIKMAKQQDLPLNPSEISGICGRLLCCLSYEHNFYAEVKARLPKVGSTITTPEGPGKVISHNVLAGTVRVQLPSEAIIEFRPEGLEDLEPYLADVKGTKPAARSPADLLTHMEEDIASLFAGPVEIAEELEEGVEEAEEEAPVPGRGEREAPAKGGGKAERHKRKKKKRRAQRGAS
jgi:cell fate regulator YaaT (PSP1 superfamily)